MSNVAACSAGRVSNRGTVDDAKWMLETMWMIREFEETMIACYRRNLIPGFIHPGIGEEAVHAGASVHLYPDDTVIATHRGHGQAIAKGASPAKLLAEALGREMGVFGGRGGSLHFGDPTVGCLPASPLVGGGVGMATGVALANAMQGSDRVAVAFFGDGALNRGSLHEAANLAAVWKLPIVFACIDNGWAISVSRSRSTAGTNRQRAAAYDLPAWEADGKDVFSCVTAMDSAIERAREGGGPSFVFFDCPRSYGHEEGDAEEYRPPEDRAAARAVDPLVVAEEHMLNGGLVDLGWAHTVRAKVKNQMSEALEVALSAPEPDPGGVMAFVRPSEVRREGDRVG